MSMRMLWASLGLAVLLVSGCSNAQPDTEVAGVAEALRERSLDFEVEIREAGSATIHATVYTSSWPSTGATLLAVPGLSETGKVFEPLSRTIFADRKLRRQIGRVIALDLVGRGESSAPRDLPDGPRFGELTIEDNVSVVVQSITALRKRGLAPRLIVGHSMGGLAVLSAQQTLLAEGSSLAELGIRSAILIAPVPPHDRPWVTGPAADVTPLVKESDELGSYLELTPEAFIAQAYARLDGTLASNAPLPADVEEAGYVAREPLATLFQLLETPVEQPDGSTLVIPRPTVDAEAFAPRNRTRLTLLGFSEDVLVQSAPLGELYTYLTGEPEDTGYRHVVADDAVHNTFTSHPERITTALKR
jgi:pimeloyl-ACP methyl ester carboxylesterase